MLSELYIKDFGIFSEQRIHFHSGMTVLTGETGAGKSLIVGAIALILGGRASTEDIRGGAKEAIVEATFEPQQFKAIRAILDAAGIAIDDRRLIIRRVLHGSGRSRLYLNGVAATLTTLSQVVPHLVDLSGQHEHQELLDSSRHRTILDQFAAHASLYQDYCKTFAGLRQIHNELNRLQRIRSDAKERLDYLTYCVRELESLELSEDEEEQLKLKKQRMQHAAKLFEVAQRLVGNLDEEDGAVLARLGGIRRDLEQASSYDDSLTPYLDEFDSAENVLKELRAHLTEYVHSLDFDSAERDRVEQRLLQLAEVRRKYGSIAEAMVKLTEMRKELVSIENVDGDMAELKKQRQHMVGKLLKHGRSLSKSRGLAAKRLQKVVAEELEQLAMQAARFSVRFHAIQSGESDVVEVEASEGSLCAAAGGLESVEFLFSANVGEPLKPLVKIASGGELSRVMLAIKLVLTADRAKTFVFDEVDSGIGGHQAEVVGAKLKALATASNGQQVFCVTHLAPIAAHADHHLRVAKNAAAGRTIATANYLRDHERRQEIARMLAGARVTERSLAHAEEMLQNR